MAKKKRKRNRRPIAPPVHSAPGTPHGPAGHTPADPPPSRPYTPEPPAAGEHAPPAPPRPRDPARRRPQQRRKKRRLRPYVIAGLIVLAIVGAIVGRQILGNRSLAQFNDLARAAGCSELRVTSDSGAGQHLGEGQTTTYDTSPPTHGAHSLSSLSAGIYDEPFSRDPDDDTSIYRAVHSLEHGYIILWHDGLETEELREIEREHNDERKIIVVPYPELRGETKLVMTAWGRMVGCEGPAPRVIDQFIERFREARSAPEPRAP